MTAFSLLQNGQILYWYTMMSSFTRWAVPPRLTPAEFVFEEEVGDAAAAAEQSDTRPPSVTIICLCTATADKHTPAPPTVKKHEAGRCMRIVRQSRAIGERGILVRIVY